MRRLLAAGTGAVVLLAVAAPMSATAGAMHGTRHRAPMVASAMTGDDDIDRYEGRLPAWGRIPVPILVRRGETITVRGSSPDTDLDLELVNADGETVAQDTRPAWNARVRFHSHRNQALTLLVENGSEVPGHFDLTISRSF